MTISVIVILFYSTAFANVYEIDNNGVPTFSNVDTKGAKQVSVDKPQVVNSYNQISNGPSLNDYKQKRDNQIVWKNQGSRGEERSSQDIKDKTMSKNRKSEDIYSMLSGQII